MAQGAVAAPFAIPNGVGVESALTAEETRLIAEYEKIVQMKDAILAGTHPRIKLPHLVAKQNATRNFSSPTTSTSTRANNVVQRSTPNSLSEDASSFRSPNNNNRPAVQIPKSGKSEINPILLEKSDDLIKAEMQLQRQRLERKLRDQIEQQRIASKAALQTSESLPSFDISEVLVKALAIVHPSTPAQVQLATADEAPASDSFDENTFYSSQHDSSDWSNSSQGQKEPLEVQSGGLVSVGGRPGGSESTQSHIQDREKVVASASLSTNNQPAAQKQYSQHLTDAADLRKQLSGMGNSTSHAAPATSRDSTDSPYQPAEASHSHKTMGANGIAPKAHDDHQSVVQRTTDDLLRQAFEEDRPPPPPLIRAHNLSPIAPQPARVSPLATAREPPVLRENILADDATPAQVAALRNQTGISSTDSSPKGARVNEKKKGGNKKKKRKAKDSADTTEDSPYIKPEPRSPSPFPVVPLPRPQKRQRQSGQYSAELNYDEPRYEATQGRAPELYTEVREARAYQRADEPYEVFRRPAPPLRRVEDDAYRRTASDTYARRPQSPAVYATPSYAHSETRSVRAASHAIVDRRVEEPKYYGQPVTRTVIRQDSDRERSRSPVMRDRRSPIAMGPRPAVRIVQDEFGNEYYDPAPVRQSVAPPVRYREEVVYERPPMRVVSSRPEIYEDDGAIYRRPSPPPARRVVTQPEYAMAPPAYRSYREREYSVRPAGDEYVQRRPVYEEPLREYVTRAQSIRPEASDEPRYATREFTSRAQSIHPDASDEPRYAVHEESRGYPARATVFREEVPQNYSRAASVRPDAVRYETREDAPREYAAPRVQALRDEGREYIPRPRSVRPDHVRYEEAPVIREELPRDYTRAGSVRLDAVRYEVPREYAGRLQSVRPEAPPREYAGSVRPEVRREREFSSRPVDSLNRREQVPVAKGERYYEEVPGQMAPPVAFIERPRAREREASVLVYADDVRREVYR